VSCTFASINFSLIQWFSVSILEINKRKWLGLFDFLTHLFYRFLNKKEREKYISLLFRLWKIVTKITSCFDIVNQSFSFRYHPVSSCCSIKQFSLRRDHFLPPSCQPLSRRLHCSWHLLDDDISLLWSRGSFSRRERGWHSPRQPCSCKESRKREREREREREKIYLPYHAEWYRVTVPAFDLATLTIFPAGDTPLFRIAPREF